jgi:hypothetical protein
MILCGWFDYHIYFRFPTAQIRFLAEPEDWAAISVVLQLYGCRMKARKGRAGGH